MNDSEIKRMWLYAAEKWPNYPLPPTAEQREMRLEAWRDTFGDVPAEAVHAALLVPLLAQRDFFPPLGQVRAAALAAGGYQGPPDVDQAWLEVQTAVRRVGYDGDPDWSHPAIAETVAAVRWRNLCHSTEGDPDVWRQFRDFYRLASTRHDAAATTPPMAALNGAGYPRQLGGGG